MDTIDLKKVLIADTPYYNPGSSYVGMLKRNNITTVDQLLSDGDWKFKCYTKTRSQLRGFIAMVKYFYLGEQPCYEALLDKKIELNYIRNDIDYQGIHLELVDSKYNRKKTPDVQISLTELLGCPEYMASFIMRKFASIVKSNKLAEEGLPIQPKLIDFLEWILTEKKYKQVFPYIRSYIEMHDKKFEAIDFEKIDILVRERMLLLKMQEDIQKQIAEVEEQLAIYSHLKNRNGGRR